MNIDRDRDWSDAALLLVAHGSSLNADSAKAARDHADRLRERGLFALVRVAFHKQEPLIRDVSAEIEAVAGATRSNVRRVFVMPLFLSDGYFTQQVLPRELRLLGEGEAGLQRIQQRGALKWLYCLPFGTHARMTELVLARADEVVAEASVPAPRRSETALLLAAHGTEKTDQSRRAAEWQVEQIRAQGGFAEVHAVYLEEDPQVSSYPNVTTQPNIIMVPFFISDGLHAREDVPVLLGEDPERVRERIQLGQPTWNNPTDRCGKRIWYSRSIGTSPLVADVVLERVREMEGS